MDLQGLYTKIHSFHRNIMHALYKMHFLCYNMVI